MMSSTLPSEGNCGASSSRQRRKSAGRLQVGMMSVASGMACLVWKLSAPGLQMRADHLLGGEVRELMTQPGEPEA